MGFSKGFASLTLVAGIAAALVLGALGVQTYRVGALHEEVAAERVGRELALERIRTLAVEKRAAEASLAERDAAHDEIRRLRVATGRRLEEVERGKPEVVAALDCAVPGDVRQLLRDRRGGGQSAASAPAGNPAAPVPAPSGRPVNAS